MTDHPKVDVDELREKAERATKGEWHEGDHWVFVSPRDGVPTSALENILRDVPEAQDNAAYIVAAQPSVILSLLTERDALRARVGELEKALEPFDRASRDVSGTAIIFDSVEQLSIAKRDARATLSGDKAP